MELADFRIAARQSIGALWRAAPLILGIILLIALLQTLFPPTVIAGLFHQHVILDALVGSTLGSILAGSPITSYVIGGELLNQGVSLTAVTAFIVAWVTVGVVQFPAEAAMLGKKFTLARNAFSFVFSIGVAVSTVIILSIL